VGRELGLGPGVVVDPEPAKAQDAVGEGIAETACSPARRGTPALAAGRGRFGVVATDAPDGLLRMLAVDAGQAWLVETPMLERSFTGSGDLTAAMFLAHWLRTKDLGETLGVTASVVYSILEQTSISGEAELQLVAAQEQVVNPVNRFTAHSL